MSFWDDPQPLTAPRSLLCGFHLGFLAAHPPFLFLSLSSPFLSVSHYSPSRCLLCVRSQPTRHEQSYKEVNVKRSCSPPPTAKWCVRVAQSCPILCNPMDYSPPGSSVHGILQAAGVGSHSFLQGTFPTQGSNPHLLHCRRTLYFLNHQGSPGIMTPHINTAPALASIPV